MCRVFDHSSMNVCVRTLTGSESFFELGGDLAEVHPMMFTYHFLIHLTQFKSKSANELRCNSKLFQETAWKLKFCSGEATVLDLKLAIQSRIAVPRREQRLAASCRSLEFQKPYDCIYIYIHIIVYILTYSIIFIWVCAKIGDAPKWQIQLGKRCIGFGGSYQANPARIKDVVVQRSLVSHASRPQLCICFLMFAGCKPDHVGPVAEAFKAGKLLLHDGLRLTNVAAEVPSKLSQILFLAVLSISLHFQRIGNYWDQWASWLFIC